MARLAQAYVHIRAIELDTRGLERLGVETERAAAEIAERVYGFDVTVDVWIESGSTRTRITVIGLLVGTYSLVADYKGFKDSIGEMCNDARTFAGDMCGTFIELTKASDRQVYRVERRLMTPGKLDKTIKRLEKLDVLAPKMSRRELDRELEDVQREIERIRKDLTNEEVSILNRVLVFENLPPLVRVQRRSPSKELEIQRLAVRPRGLELPLFEDDDKPDGTGGGGKRRKAQRKKRLVYHNKVSVRSKRSIQKGHSKS